MPAETSRSPVPDLTEEGQVREFFALDAAPDVAPYARIRRRVLEARSSGELPAGQRMPPVRRLAEMLGIAPNTVAKAYKELEAAGALEGRGRAGSFIRAASGTEDRAVRATEKYLAELERLGLERPEALALVRRVLDREA